MFNIKRLLSHACPDVLVEVAVCDDGIHQIVAVTNVDKDSVEFVSTVMEGAGYTYTPTGKETASLGALEFTNLSPYQHLAEDADYDSDETEDLEGSGQDVDNSELSSASVTSIDGDGRAFRVLTTPEMHKFAMKVYTGMLGNTKDMANYGVFAYDLDNFLAMHINSETSFDDDEEEGEDEDGISVPEAASHSITVEEVASVLLNANGNEFLDTFGKYIPAETANAKIIGRIILGIIIKHIGGKVAASLVSAWEAKNKNAFERILFTIVKMIVRDRFPEEDFTYKGDLDKYGDYEFKNERLYNIDIDLDDYTIEQANTIYAKLEEASSAGNAAIARLLIAVFIKIMAGAVGRMLIDSWIKRDKSKFERSLMYMMLEALKYVPFKSYAESASIEQYEDGLLIDYASFEEEEIEGPEVARKKEKTGRGALLSALMGALSGKTGDKAAAAWDNGDMDTMVAILGEVTEKVLESMPYDENSESEADEPSEEVETEDTAEEIEEMPSVEDAVDDITTV